MTKEQREKQIKTLKNRVEKNILDICQKSIASNRVEKKFLDIGQKSIASLFSKNVLNEKTTYQLKKNLEMENKPNRDDLIY